MLSEMAEMIAAIERKEEDPNTIVGNMTFLMHGAKEGNVGVITRLLKVDNLKVNAKNKDGLTALHLAAASGSEECLAVLLTHSKIEKDAVTREGATALHLAVEGGHYGCAMVLLKADANPDVKDIGGNTALHTAVHRGEVNADKVENVEFANLLIMMMEGVNAQNLQGETALHLAVTQNKKGWYELLLENNADVNIQTKGVQGGDTVLHLAVEEGIPRCLVCLVRVPGIDANIMNKRGYAAIHCATKYGKFLSVKTLLDVPGIDIGLISSPKKGGVTPLLYTVRAGDKTSFDLLLEAGRKGVMGGIALNEQSTDTGVTALMQAASSGYLDMVDALLTQNANVALEDFDGKNAQQRAEERKPRVKAQIAELAAKIEKLSKKLQSLQGDEEKVATKRATVESKKSSLEATKAELEAVLPNYDKIVKNLEEAMVRWKRMGTRGLRNKQLILTEGARDGSFYRVKVGAAGKGTIVSKKDTHGKTALDYARQRLKEAKGTSKEQEVQACVEFLQKFGDSGKAIDGIREAAKCGDILAIKALIAYVDDINEQDGNGKTALDYAKESLAKAKKKPNGQDVEGLLACVQYLEKKSAEIVFVVSDADADDDLLSSLGLFADDDAGAIPGGAAATIPEDEEVHAPKGVRGRGQASGKYGFD